MKKVLALVSVFVLLFTAGCSQENNKDHQFELENSFSSVSNKSENTPSATVDGEKSIVSLYDKYKNATIQDVYTEYGKNGFNDSYLNYRFHIYKKDTPCFFYTYESSLREERWLEYAIKNSPKPDPSMQITGLYVEGVANPGVEVYDGIHINDNPQRIKEKFPNVNLNSQGAILTEVNDGEIEWQIVYGEYIDSDDWKILNAEITYYPDNNSSTTATGTNSTGKKNTTSSEKHVHSFGKWQPEWDEKTHYRSCSCGEKEYGVHNFDNGTVTQEATHVKGGIKEYKCVDCGATKGEGIPKIEGHKYGEWELDFDKKSHVRYCSCGLYEKESHSFNSGNITKKATHISQGMKVFTCNVCGYDKEEKIPMSSAHEYGAWQEKGTMTHIRYCACGLSEQGSHKLKYDSYNSTSSVSVYKCECGYSEKKENYQEPESKYVSESKYVPEVEKEPETTKYHYSCYYAKYTVDENTTGTYCAQSADQVADGIAGEGGTVNGAIQYYEVTTNEYKGEYFEAKSGIWVYLD